MKRNLATILIALAVTGGTTAVVFANTSGASPDGMSASWSQYGCPHDTYGSHCKPPCDDSHTSSLHTYGGGSQSGDDDCVCKTDSSKYSSYTYGGSGDKGDDDCGCKSGDSKYSSYSYGGSGDKGDDDCGCKSGDSKYSSYSYGSYGGYDGSKDDDCGDGGSSGTRW